MNVRTAARSFIAGTAIVIATLGSIAPAGAAVIRPSGDSRLATDLNCGTGTVFESLPVVTGATPGQTAWQTTQVLLFDWTNSRAVTQQWSGWRYSTVNGFGSAGPVWTEYGRGFGTRQATYSVPPGTYAVRQWTYVDGGWIARLAVAPTGHSICFA